MESLFNGCSKVMVLLIVVCWLQFFNGNCVEFEVGGENGWVIPKSKNDDQVYNQWAASNRFKVDDTVRFKYEKDSVMVVTEEEYEKCKSSHPFFFSNNGDSVFKFDRPGLFYFISGVSGHCERGQKMIIKVLELETPPQSANQNSTSETSSAAIQMPLPPIFVLFAISISIFRVLLS